MDAAFWEGGWFGVDKPLLNKFYRSAVIIVDKDNFSISNKYVDHENTTFSVPGTIAARTLTEPRIGIDQKAKLLNYRIDFPTADIDCAILQLSNSYIPRSER
jgi:hypothetical protein